MLEDDAYFDLSVNSPSPIRGRRLFEVRRLLEHRNIKTQGVTTVETSFIKLNFIKIDFVNHLKPRRVEFFQCIFKNILLR